MSELRDPPASDDFEWVNSWADASTPPTGGKPRQEPAQRPSVSPSDLAERPAPREVVAAEPARPGVGTQSRDGLAQHPAEIVAPKPPVAAQSNFADRVAQVSRKRGPDAEQFVHPATRRFFAALRTPTSASRSDAPAAPIAPAPDQNVQPIPALTPAAPMTTSPELPPEAAPAAAEVREKAPIPTPATITASQPAKVESAEASLAPDASQLERDIAEIECARDALLEPAPFTITDPRKPRSPFSALRHAESVPILVGSVVGATLLIVFGAAASLISLR